MCNVEEEPHDGAEGGLRWTWWDEGTALPTEVPCACGSNTVLVPSCSPAVVCPLPRGRSWGTLVSLPPGGTSYL